MNPPASNKLKTPLSIEKQIELLQSRGLIINDYNKAYNFLLNNNYYRVNYYFHRFSNESNNFFPETNFEQIISRYENDRSIRANIFSLLEPIEIRLKAIVSYFLATKYGADAFYKKELFTWEDSYDQMVNYFKNDLLVRDCENPIIKHHNNHYSGYFPIWVILELFTFSKTSMLYRNLLSADRTYISKKFFNLPEQLFRNWIHSLSVTRNICAHYGYLYKRGFPVNINYGGDSRNLHGYENKLFGIFYCLKRLSKPHDWDKFSDEVIYGIGKETLINSYEFPNDFRYLEY